MDLGTITKKLGAWQYASPQDVLEDVQLVRERESIFDNVVGGQMLSLLFLAGLPKWDKLKSKCVPC